MYNFYNDCVSWLGSNSLEELEDIIDKQEELTYEEFFAEVSLDHVVDDVFPFYAKQEEDGLTLKKDWAVRFNKSEFEGKTCYVIVHSAIEYVFTK